MVNQNWVQAMTGNRIDDALRQAEIAITEVLKAGDSVTMVQFRRLKAIRNSISSFLQESTKAIGDTGDRIHG